MRKFNQFLLFAVFLSTASVLCAQLNVQATRWAVPGKQIDFNNYPATASALSTGTVVDGINSYTYMDGPMLFQIVDYEIKSASGISLEEIGNLSTWRGPEYATTEVKNDCNTYITFYIERNYYSMFTNESLCYSKYVRNPVSGAISMLVNGQILQTELQDAYGGIALSKERADGSRFLYYASTMLGTKGYVRKYTIDASGNIDNGVDIYTGLNYQPFRMTELELSHDGSRLAFSRAAIGPNINENQDVVIFELNPTTGNLSNSNPITINLRPNDASNNYPGIEFDANGQYLYVLEQNGKLFRVTMSNYSSTEFYNFNSLYSNSQLELGRDGWFYLAKSDGLYRMDANGNISTFASGTMAYNELLANRGCTAYVLPDQIDGQDYKTYSTSIDCCYEHNESPIKTPSMTGVSHNPTTGDITITGSNVQWNQTSNPFTSGGQAITDAYLKGSIRIEAGAKLIVFGLSLHFKEGESIDMNYSSVLGTRGPQLYLYSNSKLTVFDECSEDALWNGINLNGVWCYTQADSAGYPTRQPKVYMSSSSTIEFAEKGIEVIGGGIASAQLANFKDNINDVKFTSYSSFGDNISYFDRCNFYTTAELYDKGYNPTYHAHIWSAPGLEFKGCDFYNNYAYNNGISYSNWGSGILSSLSSLLVCDKNSDPCTFSHLNYGIKASSGSYLTLQNSDFTDCVRGAWLIANNAITTTSNDFDVSTNQGSGSSYYDSFGLYIEASTGYQIEDNNFHDGLLGLVVYASGGAENIVYRNSFEDLMGNGVATGFVGIGMNYDTIWKSGLQLRCDSFINVHCAMAVLGGNIYNQSGSLINVTMSDIRGKQGVLIPSGTDVSAYNYFSGIPYNPITSPYRYLFINGSVSFIVLDGDKYSYNQTDVTGYRLEHYNSSHISTYNLPAEECASTLGLFMASGIEEIISQTEDYEDYESYLQNELTDLTNNSLSLFISAQSANSNNASEIYDQLSSSSPYLTSEVLLAYLDNPNVPELSKVSLMLENSPLPSDVVEAVEQSDLSPEYIDYILKHQEGVNEIEQLHNQIISLESARQINYDHLMRATFNADSIASFADTYNSVLEYMESQTDYHAKNRLVDMYIKKGMFEKALTVLSEMEQIAMSSENTSKLNDIKLNTIKIDILQNINTEPIVDIVKKYEEFLTELANDYNTKEGGVARAILESAGLWDNFPIVFLPNPEGEISTKSAFIEPQEEEKPIVNYELESLFKLYPNPANDYLSVEFINPNGNCTFNIYSIKGELLKSITSNQQIGFISIDISNLSPGNYIINCPELQSKINFVVAR